MRNKLIVMTTILLLPLCVNAQSKQEKWEKMRQTLTDSVQAIYAAELVNEADYANDSTWSAIIGEFGKQLDAEIAEVVNRAMNEVEKKYNKILDAIAKRKRQIEKERLKAQKEIEKQNAQNETSQAEKDPEKEVDMPATSAVAETEEAEVPSYPKDYWDELETQLKGAKEHPNLDRFVAELFSQDTCVQHYYPLLADMEALSKRIGNLNAEIGGRLSGFVKDVRAVNRADSVLYKPYNKQAKDEALAGLDSISFLSTAQLKASGVDSLKEGLRYYYLTTSNMLDLIKEIQDAHRDKNQDALKESFSFEARIDNFKMVPYMWRMYDEIILHSVVKYAEDGESYLFEQFDIKRLETLKQELEEVRKSK